MLKKLLCLAALLAAPAATLAAQQPAPRGGLVYRIPVTGEIAPGLVPFIQRSVKEAEEAGAAAAILDMDTPGGFIDSAEQISDALQDAKIPTYTYVNRRALSAGVMLALATDGIFMRPASSLGAATPVDATGTKAPEKYVSAMRSAFRSLAQARGLDPRVAEAMVDEEIEVPGIDEKGKLLTLSTTEAVRIGWAREVADWDAMLAAVNAPGARVVTAEINWAERLVRFLSTPFIASLLLTVGMLGIIIELKTPHFGLAGLAGVLSLGAFFGSHMLIGLAGWETVLLLAAGIVLLLVEMFVLPGFGVAGVLGVAAVVGSILLAMLSAFPTGGDVAIALAVLSTSLVLVFFTLWALIRHLPNDRRGRALLLQTSTSRDAGYVAGRQRADLEGMDGVALTDLRPAGTAQFGDEPLDVVSEGGWVKAGTRVRVLRSEHYRHVVRPVAALEETVPVPQPSEQAGD